VRCAEDGDTRLTCDEDGRWVVQAVCSEAQPGDVCENGACIKLCELNKKLNSYFGCEYWALDLDNAFVPGGPTGFYDAAGAPFAVVVGNPNEKFAVDVKIYTVEAGVEQRVTVDHFGNPLDDSPIAPSSLRIYRLPRRDVEGTVKGFLSYRVEASIPILAYQFNPLDNTSPVFSNDASLLLPTDVLGRTYIVMTREQTFANLRGFVTVVAPFDNTEVALTVTAPTLSMNGFPPLQPGQTVRVNLARGEVFSVQSDAPGADLTGTVVQANRVVAVFGGSEASNAPNTARCLPEGVCEWDRKTACADLLDCVDAGFNTCCADHLEQQMFPVRSWGQRYIATQSKERGKAKDIWRILAAEDGTQVDTVPKQASIPVLDKGEWFEFESSEHFVIDSKKPILVGQFLAAEDAPDPNLPGVDTAGDAGIGDPGFILAVPLEQYREEYVVLVPEGYGFDYVNITAPAGAAVWLDGEELDPSVFEPITADYVVARLALEDGERRIRASAPVGVVMYGFDSYVSYGYPGGLDLEDLGLIKEPPVAAP
jgi:hypothetical protein